MERKRASSKRQAREKIFLMYRSRELRNQYKKERNCDVKGLYRGIQAEEVANSTKNC